MRGDFTASHQRALQARDGTDKGVQRGKLAQWVHGNLIGLDNQNYGLFINNCGQVAMSLLFEGTLPDGTNMRRFAAQHGYGIAAIPNWNLINMKDLFKNDATNLTGFQLAIQAERERIGAMGWFARLWNDGDRVLRILDRIDFQGSTKCP
jgi:hypothetical protein